MKGFYIKFFFYFLIVFLLITVLSCENSTEPEQTIDTQLPAININWSDSNSVVCFGTSITAGQLDSDSTYPKLLGDRLKIEVYNYGQWGNMASKGIEQFNNDISDKNPALIILEFGANEFLRGFELTTARNNIDLLIKEIKSANIQIVFLNFIHPNMLKTVTADSPLYEKKDLALEYYDMIEEVSESNDVPLVEYIYKNIWGVDELLLSDGLHPNNKGNVILTENIFYSLKSTFEINDMLK